MWATCELKKQGSVVEEQYGRWKNTVKDVYNVRKENGLKGVSDGLGGNTTL